MRVMQSLPTRGGFIVGEAGCARSFFERWCPAEFDEQPVGSVAERDVSVIQLRTVHGVAATVSGHPHRVK